MFDNHHNYTDYEEEMNPSSYNPTIVQTAFSALMRKVYLWMTFALVVTGLTALVASGNQQFMYAIMSSRGLFLGLIIAEVAMVITLSAAINRLSFMTAGMLFIAYSILNGLTMSFIFLAYTDTSIATTMSVPSTSLVAQLSWVWGRHKIIIRHPSAANCRAKSKCFAHTRQLVGRASKASVVDTCIVGSLRRQLHTYQAINGTNNKKKEGQG